MSATYLSVLFSVVAGVATLLGGLMITIPSKLSRQRLSHVMAFGAGYMLAAAFVSMVPESIEHASAAPFWILSGYVLAHLFEHAFTSHFHFGEETHTEHVLEPGVSTTTLVGLVLHAFFDGVAISAGFLISAPLGIFIALAVILHKIPEGVTIASVMIAAGRSRRNGLQATTLVALATVIGCVGMLQLGAIRGIGLAISAGIAIYVAATDLIPVLNQQRERSYSLSALVGLALYFGVHWLMRRAGIH